VTVRAIATRDLTGANAWRCLRREVLAALITLISRVVIGMRRALVWRLPALGYRHCSGMVDQHGRPDLRLLDPIALDKAWGWTGAGLGAFVTR